MQARMLVAILVVVVMLGACGGAQSSSPTPAANNTAANDGAALLEARCTQCHGLDRVKQARLTQEQWQQTVTRMERKGATLTADEQTVLVTYLAETYKP